MPRLKNPDEANQLAAVVAYLSSGEGGRSPLSQDQIAAMKLPGLASQPAVSRAFTQARKQGYLIDAARELDRTRLEADGVLLGTDHFAKMTKLRETIGAVAKREGWQRVPTVHSIPVRVNTAAPTERRRQLFRSFFKQAGSVVYNLIGDCAALGVSWGETVANTISALEAQAPLRASKPRKVEAVVPLVGEPPAGETSEFSSTLLAERLYRALGGTGFDKGRYSLRYVHSFISDDLSRWHEVDDLEVGRQRALQYYEKVSSYRSIFGGTKSDMPSTGLPIIESLDAILTSLSSDKVPWGITTQLEEPIRQRGRGHSRQTAYMLPADQQVMNEVAQVAIGDICGVLLPGESHTDLSARSDLQRRWTGIRPEHLLRHAERAATPGHPGVVVVAFGAKKVLTTLAAMREGYVNHLVIGEALAHELDKQLTRVLRQKSRTY